MYQSKIINRNVLTKPHIWNSVIHKVSVVLESVFLKKFIPNSEAHFLALLNIAASGMKIGKNANLL